MVDGFKQRYSEGVWMFSRSCQVFVGGGFHLVHRVHGTCFFSWPKKGDY